MNSNILVILRKNFSKQNKHYILDGHISLTDGCRLQHNDLENNRQFFYLLLYINKLIVPGSISPIITPITSYVSLSSRRLYVVTSNELLTKS